MLEISY